jgi:hypothetical protein
MCDQSTYGGDGISSINEFVMMIIDQRLSFALKLPHLWAGRHVRVAICYDIAQKTTRL